jgi:hypothetical protein
MSDVLSDVSEIHDEVLPDEELLRLRAQEQNLEEKNAKLSQAAADKERARKAHSLTEVQKKQELEREKAKTKGNVRRLAEAAKQKQLQDEKAEAKEKAREQLEAEKKRKLDEEKARARDNVSRLTSENRTRRMSLAARFVLLIPPNIVPASLLTDVRSLELFPYEVC